MISVAVGERVEVSLTVSDTGDALQWEDGCLGMENSVVLATAHQILLLFIRRIIIDYTVGQKIESTTCSRNFRTY